MIHEWGGYVSSVDSTNIAEDVLVGGSQNVYKKLSGTIAVRQGQKRLGVANTIISPIFSKFVWYTSWGQTYTMVISNNNLYVVINNVWYSLLQNLNKTRYVFDKWWNNTEKKDRLLFVNGTPNIFHWSGGFAIVNGLNAIVTSINPVPTAGGTGYTIGDILTISGGATNATVTVTSVNAGVVTGITLTTGGSVYTTGVGKLTTGGTGNGATVEIVSVASPSANTLTLKDVTKNWQQLGFASATAGEMKFMMGGIEYTYTGGFATSTLTGVTPSVAGVVDGSIAIQSVQTASNLPDSTMNNDYIKVIANQAYIGSYTSRFCYISSNTDFTNFTIPVPRLAGSPELIILDGTGKGIGLRQGNACLAYGTYGWSIITFADQSNNNILTNVTTKTDKPLAILQAPLAHEFIDTVNDNLIYLGQDHQVRQFGDFNTAFVSMYPSLSQEVATELNQENFTGGSLKCIGEFIYITAPNSGKVYLRQERTRVDQNGTVVSEKLWHSPFILNATHIDQINGTVVSFSNSNPQIYQVWDTGQWHDDSPTNENLPYTSIMALGYRGEQRRQGLWSFDKQFTEGFLTSGTLLNLTINYNYQGATNIINAPINSLIQPAYTFGTSVNSLGDATLGDDTLGNGGIDTPNQDLLVKFKVINSVALTNCFEWQPIYSSNAVDSQWEIIAVGTNAIPENDQYPTFIINKKRN